MASYIESQLIPGETLVYRGEVSGWSLFPYWFFGILTCWLGVGLLILLAGWLKMRSTELAVTNKRIIAKFGFISRTTMELPLTKTEAMSAHQSIVGRIFGHGTIIIAGTGGSPTPIPGIRQPLEFKRQAFTAAEALR